MKTLLTAASTLALATHLLTAHAQATPSTTAAKAAKAAKTADQRADTYQGPKVVKDSKVLGQKMVQKSKPTDMHVPPPVKVK